MSKEKQAIDEAKAFSRSAKASLDRGDINPCINSLFYVIEHVANVVAVRKGGKATKDHATKVQRLKEAYSEGAITAEEYKACVRVSSLRIYAQEFPYVDVDVKPLRKDEAISLCTAMEKLVARVEKAGER
jgi:uncharacterized protein (UPF0332 family)